MKTNQSRLDKRALHGLLRASRARAAHHERGVLKERVERKAERREQVVDGAIVAFKVDAVAVGAAQVRICGKEVEAYRGALENRRCGRNSRQQGQVYSRLGLRLELGLGLELGVRG